MKKINIAAMLLSLAIAAAPSQAQGALDCPVVEGHWPYGPGRTTEVWTGGGESLLFLGAGAVLQIYDVSDPTNMTQLSEVPLNDPVWRVDISDDGTMAAVSDGGKWIRLVDVSDRAAPVEVGRYEVEDGRLPNGVAFAGDYLVAAVAPAGLWVIDISDPTTPTLEGQYIEPGTDFVWDVEVLGTHAFVADDTDGVTVVDFSNPAVPVKVGGYTASTNASHIAIDGTRAIVSEGNQGFKILDLSSPTAPTLISEVTSEFAWRTEVSGDYLVIASISGLIIYDITTPTLPVLKGSLPGGLFTATVDPATTTAFAIPDYVFNKQLRAIDYSAPASPVQIDSVDLLSESLNVEIAGDIGIVANNERGLVFLDLSTGSDPKQLGRYETDNARSVAYFGTHAIVANFGNQLPVIDFSDPTTPVLADTVSISGTSFDVKVQGNRAYVAATSGGLRILDMTTPTAVTELGSFIPAGGGGTTVSVQGDVAFLTSNTDGWVVDVTDPMAPFELATFSLSSTTSNSDVEGDYYYVAHMDGVSIFDVSVPTMPTLVTTVDTLPTFANGVDVVGDRLYIAADTFYGLLIYDVSDPTDPDFDEWIETPGAGKKVAATADYVLVADGNFGVRTFACEQLPIFVDGFESGDISAWGL